MYDRSAYLREKYDITVEDYDAMLTAQGGVCAVCGQPPGDSRLVVDHCHRHAKKHGKRASVRGLVHGYPCNYILLRKGFDPAILEGAARYLRKPPAPAVLGEGPIPPPARSCGTTDRRAPALILED